MATSTIATIAHGAFLHKPLVGVSSSPVLGLPGRGMKGRVRCSMGEVKANSETTNKGKSNGSLVAAVSAAAAATMSSPAAMALVDERMTTEGTGLPFGLSNNVLVWILLGVFALIWAFYSVYTSTLDEDEESGLSL